MAKILIMDGETNSRTMVSNMLRPLGHALIGVADGKRAIDTAQKEKPDIALLDMQVVDMEGTEVLMEMKKIRPDMKCIMVSGFGDEVDVRGVMGLGALGVLSKPFKITEVHKTVMAAVQGKAPGAAVPRPPVRPAAAPAPVAPATPPAPPVYQAPVPPAEAPVPVAAAAPAPLPVQEPVYGQAPARSFPVFKILAGALVALVAAGIFLFTRMSGAAPQGKEYTLSYSNAAGMCSIRANLWISDWMSGNIYQHSNDEKLSIATVYKSDNQHPTGLAFDGDCLWSCNSAEKRIYKHRIDASLSVVSIYAMPSVSPQGLYFDGVNMWVIDSEAAKIYKHKMDDTFSIVAVFDSPAINPCGMFKDGEYFYIGDYKTGKVYKASTKDLTVNEVFELPGFNKDTNKLAGITWDGHFMWVCYEGVPKIFRHGLANLQKVSL
jgi:CheY-like chemotaxis protein